MPFVLGSLLGCHNRKPTAQENARTEPTATHDEPSARNRGAKGVPESWDRKQEGRLAAALVYDRLPRFHQH
jgi:hypothetical protein